jgi:hypothetical protein
MSDSRRAFLWKGLLEVAFIGVGVFLGMAADQWRTDRQHREQARAALERFKSEIELNRGAVEKVKDYHAETRTRIAAYLDPKTRNQTELHLSGIQPAVLEQTAWDLALATQALADLDQALAFELTRVYGLQRRYQGLSSGVIQAMYLRPPAQDMTAFLQSLKVYYDDAIVYEPAMLESYGRVLPLIDRALKD